MQSEQLEELVTDVLTRRYGDGGGTVPFERADFAHAFGNGGDALLYSAIFAPDFIQIDGFIFLKELGVYPAGGWAEVAAGIASQREISPAALQKFVNSINRIEVPYLFANCACSDEECDVLAQAIAHAWRVQLRGQFPDRAFTVRVMPPAETGSVVGVGFEIELDRNRLQRWAPPRGEQRG